VPVQLPFGEWLRKVKVSKCATAFGNLGEQLPEAVDPDRLEHFFDLCLGMR
jgi:hypothetical protein